MKKITLLVIITISVLSCTKKIEKDSFEIIGEIIQDSISAKQAVLVTESQEIVDTFQINSNKILISGKISEPTRAAIIIGEEIIKFPLVNDKIEFKIISYVDNKYDFKYKRSLINENLKTYFDQEAEEYIKKYKLLDEQKIKSKNDSVKYDIMISLDSLALTFVKEIFTEYENSHDKSGLTIIINDLKGLIGTRNQHKEIRELYNLLSSSEKEGFYGNKIKTYLEQSDKIALGQKIDFNFVDINQEPHKISDFKDKLILLEFWASWCGPCISQIPSLKEISEKRDKIQIISVSIDEDIEKWKNKITELEMDWINIHFKQDKQDLKQDFYITGVPYNILISNEGEILRKNITMGQLKALLN
ncbi:MAG: redoxin domain-containing protein [Candidatus Lokiarchaeota archaeon]|nr:redoxin domain-containing protein [Candidatus Lokiarchaeota archaeon]